MPLTRQSRYSTFFLALFQASTYKPACYQIVKQLLDKTFSKYKERKSQKYYWFSLYLPKCPLSEKTRMHSPYNFSKLHIQFENNGVNWPHRSNSTYNCSRRGGPWGITKTLGHLRKRWKTEMFWGFRNSKSMKTKRLPTCIIRIQFSWNSRVRRAFFTAISGNSNSHATNESSAP